VARREGIRNPKSTRSNPAFAKASADETEISPFPTA